MSICPYEEKMFIQKGIISTNIMVYLVILNLHIDEQSDYVARDFIDLLNSMDLNQRVLVDAEIFG